MRKKKSDYLKDWKDYRPEMFDLTPAQSRSVKTGRVKARKNHNEAKDRWKHINGE